MGRLYRRAGTPFWYARWQDADGVHRRESTGTADRRVASLWLSAREAEAIRAGAGGVRPISLADALGLYLEQHQPPVWSDRWYRVAYLWWRSRLVPDLGGPEAPLHTITTDTVSRARARWSAEVKPGTVNRLCAVGSGLWKWALHPDRRYAERNPFQGLPRFRERRHDPPDLTPAQLEAFLAELRPEVVQRAAVLALETGAALGELRRVRRQDVTLDPPVLLVRGTKAAGRWRRIPLTPRALAALLAGPEGDPLAGLPLNIRKALHGAQARSGVPRFRWHDLRHYALTRVVAHGLWGQDLTRLAGWSTMAMADRYIHPSEERIRAALCATTVPPQGDESALSETQSAPSGTALEPKEPTIH